MLFSRWQLIEALQVFQPLAINLPRCRFALVVEFDRGVLFEWFPSVAIAIPSPDGTLQTADSWLQQNIEPLIASSTFQNDGLLIIVFDEADTSDSSNGGGHIAAVIISPKAKRGFQSTILYQ